MKSITEHLQSSEIINEALSREMKETLIATVITGAIDLKHGNVQEFELTPHFEKNDSGMMIQNLASKYADNADDYDNEFSLVKKGLEKFVNQALKEFGWYSQYMLGYFATNHIN